AVVPLDAGRIAARGRRADPQGTARPPLPGPHRTARLLRGVWGQEPLGPRVRVRGRERSNRTTSGLDGARVRRRERDLSRSNRPVPRGHLGPRGPLGSGPGLRRADAARWGVPADTRDARRVGVARWRDHLGVRLREVRGIPTGAGANRAGWTAEVRAPGGHL